MNRFLDIFIVAAGLAVAVYGVKVATAYFGTDLSGLIAASLSHRSIWLLWGGTASIFIGILMSLRTIRH